MSLNFTAPIPGNIYDQPVTVSWEPIDNAEKYHITIATDPNFNNIIWAGESDTNSVQLDGLPDGANCFGYGIVYPALPELYIGITGLDWNRLTAHKWKDDYGFLQGFVANPTSSWVYGVAFTNPINAIACSEREFPFVHAFPFNNDNGIGTKVANPTIITQGEGEGGVCFSRDNNYILYAHWYDPWVSAYPWGPGGFGTRLPGFSGPSSTLERRSPNFNPAGDVFAIAMRGTPRIACFQWNNGFGTYFSQPSGIPLNSGMRCKFSPTGENIALSHFNSPYLTVWPFNNGYGVKYANPSVVPPTTEGLAGIGVGWHPKENAIALGLRDPPFIYVYEWSSGGFGTKYANPTYSHSTYLDDETWDLEFSPTGGALVISPESWPYPQAYAWDSVTGFGVKYANTESPSARSLAWDISFGMSS